jgi:hypothetical protein
VGQSRPQDSSANKSKNEDIENRRIHRTYINKRYYIAYPGVQTDILPTPRSSTPMSNILPYESICNILSILVCTYTISKMLKTSYVENLSVEP